MTRKISQADRERATAAALITHYRAIGPAAILAALLCAQTGKVENETGERRAA